MTNTLTYKDIEKVALTRFPETGKLVEQTFGSYYDLTSEVPAAYPIFEDVIQELIFELLDARKDDYLLRRIFVFLEEMADSNDKEVVNLLWITVLEPLVSNHERIRRAWEFMGPRTRSLSKEIAQSRGRYEGLPRPNPIIRKVQLSRCRRGRSWSRRPFHSIRRQRCS